MLRTSVVGDAANAFLSDGAAVLPGALPRELVARAVVATEFARAKQLHAPGMLREQHLIDADHRTPVFLDVLNLPVLNDVARAVIGHDDVFTIGLAVLLGAAEHDELLRWHRDFDEDHPEFRLLTAAPGSSVQFNLALFEDSALWVVPGSHTRPMTDEERAHRERWDPIAPTFQRAQLDSNDAMELFGGMPGAVRVDLDPGDILVYSPQVLHAAHYRGGQARSTLLGNLKDGRLAVDLSSLRWGVHFGTFTAAAWDGDHGRYLTRQIEVWRSLAEARS